MYEYDRVRCQRERKPYTHNESDPEYQPHIMWQSKHGPRFVSVEAAIIRAATLARMKCDKPEGISAEAT